MTRSSTGTGRLGKRSVLGGDRGPGLSSAGASLRIERFGPNTFDAGTAEPRWRAFIRRYADLIQLVRYLPPVWGWAMLAWMRRRECV